MVRAIVGDCWRVTAEDEITKQNRSKRPGIYFHLSPHLFKKACYSRCKCSDLKSSLAWVLDHCYAWYLGNIFPLPSRYSHTMTQLKGFITSAVDQQPWRLLFFVCFIITLVASICSFAGCCGTTLATICRYFSVERMGSFSFWKTEPRHSTFIRVFVIMQAHNEIRSMF